ncbi:MAG: tetratricopeptide repeat protein [Acidobacteriia bacterium]|nr:tetratricopeptide repeat protein [Terriglobia bacterium]
MGRLEDARAAHSSPQSESRLVTVLEFARYCTALASIAACAVAQPAVSVASPADIAIRRAGEEITKHPTVYSYYNLQAMAYVRRARETSDRSDYESAEMALKTSFEMAPENFETQKVQAALLIAKKEFAQALELAKKLNRRNPDDVSVYGYLADAYTELGDYKEAVAAAQWMLNLRRGNTEGMARAAYLRELYGNFSGAMEAARAAYEATPFEQVDDRAWYLTQLAHLHLLAGDLTRAEASANGALSLFSGYSYALGVLGEIRMAQARYAEAASLFSQRYRAAPRARNLYALAEALEANRQVQDAAEEFRIFEDLAVKETALADNANRELAAYYTDHAKDPVKALEVARQEIGRRHDIFTLDCYAWALANNGEYERADVEIRKALATGSKDPQILYHAKIISDRLGRPAETAPAKPISSREPVLIR